MLDQAEAIRNQNINWGNEQSFVCLMHAFVFEHVIYGSECFLAVL